MQILNCNGFDEAENTNYLRIIRSNFYSGIKELIQIAEGLEKELSEDNQDNARVFKEMNNLDDPITEEIIEQAKAIWEDDAIKEVWELKDSLPGITIINFDYFIENIDRLAQDDCVAINDDIVRCRQRTTGLSEIEFPYGKNYFHIFDVGGQKPERRKWEVIASTHKPTALLYFTSLTDYDVPLLTDGDDVTRMDESMEVWEEILNSEELENATMILFLNKSDLFEDKIEKTALRKTFSDYKGGSDMKKAVEYIKQKFLDKADTSRHVAEQIHTHTTCAIDTSVMEVVFKSVTEEIFKQRLALGGVGVV